MTQRMTVLVAALMLVCGSAWVFAQDAAAAKVHVGKIVEVAADHSQFTLQMGEGEQAHKVVLKVTAETKYELNGEPSTAQAALTVGAHARVHYKGDTATEVMVTTETKGGKPDGGHEKPNQGHEKPNHGHGKQ